MIIIFWVSIILIIYTYIGYPGLIFILRNKFNNKKFTSNKKEKEISVVMIVCNEEDSIKDKIINIYSQKYDSKKINLIIVDDASDDRTVEYINSLNDERIKLIKQNKRLGKAAGINNAMKYVHTDLVMLIDARQEISSNALTDLSSWFFSNDKTVAVSGEVKFRTEEGNISGMDAYQAYERNIRISESMIAGVPGVSGAIYMLKTVLFQPIPENTILDDVLIPMIAAKDGGWIGFDERVIAWDISSNDMKREKLRKTRTLNGNYQLLFKHPEWCFPGGHPLWFQFLSHKVLRLLAPFMAILLIVLSFSIGYVKNPLVFYIGLSALFVILLYPLSILFPIINKSSLLRIGTSFVALNWFNLLGFHQYLFSNRGQSWK
jgi:biofilm PGA synthesis N-glycosyltransferase PgaC